jgi:hypothetical protein
MITGATRRLRTAATTTRGHQPDWRRQQLEERGCADHDRRHPRTGPGSPGPSLVILAQ